MKCDNCGKEATVHEVTIRSGKKVERHLCESCARGEGLPVQSHAPVSQILTQFIAEQAAAASAGPTGQTEHRAGECGTCGMSYAQFRQGGLLGCPDCYAAFEPQLGPLLARAHEGGTHHVGKIPRRVSGKPARLGARPTASSSTPPPVPSVGPENVSIRLAVLRDQLREAVKAENYELAARLHDEIRTAETSTRAGEGGGDEGGGDEGGGGVAGTGGGGSGGGGRA